MRKKTEKEKVISIWFKIVHSQTNELAGDNFWVRREEIQHFLVSYKGSEEEEKKSLAITSLETN